MSSGYNTSPASNVLEALDDCVTTANWKLSFESVANFSSDVVQGIVTSPFDTVNLICFLTVTALSFGVIVEM